MIAVIFELEPHADQALRYFELAEGLKASLTQVAGFISIERFESLSHPGRYLSLSFWQDESAVQQWRNLEAHRAAQGEGRAAVLAHYRLRVAQVLRDYGLSARDQAPEDSRHALG
jgi:heme-degrading monooxygenase HmoA